jgi:hypothetical protein
MCGKVLYLTQNDLARNSGFATVILDYNIHRGVKSLPPFPPFPTHMHSHTHRHKTHTHTDRHKTHTHMQQGLLPLCRLSNAREASLQELLAVHRCVSNASIP